jgi:hypothetical protein
MPGLMGKGKSMTMQLAKQPSTGQSWLTDWKREFLEKPKPYGSGSLCMESSVNQATTRIWRWINQVATKMWGRDLHEPVSSLFLALAAETSSNLSYCLVYPAGRGSPSLRGTIVPKQSLRGMRLPRPDPDSSGGARNDSTDYPCPWNTLHRESDGRSWAMNNTSNLPGVE